MPAAHGRIGDPTLAAVPAPDIEGARQDGRQRLFQQHQAAGPGMEGAGHDPDEPPQHIRQTVRFHLGVVQAEKSLRFALAHLVKGAIDRQQRGQLQLFARGCVPAFELRFHERAELAQGVVRLGRRHVHLGQPAAVVLHLFQELSQGP